MRVAVSYTIDLPDSADPEALRAEVRALIEAEGGTVTYDGLSSLDEEFTVLGVDKSGEITVSHVHAPSAEEAREKASGKAAFRGRVEPVQALTDKEALDG